MDSKFKQFGDAINRLIGGGGLSLPEMRDLFSEILNGEQTEMHQGAFLSAVTAKGPTPEEIAGAWEAVFELDTIRVKPAVQSPIVDNCGTGMDGAGTFNISTAAAIVAAAGGVCIARHGARAITSRCGTVDICEAVGIDMECEAETVKNSIEKTGIGLFNGMSPNVHPRALFRILSRMCFGSILNIAASLANPARPDRGVRGVYAEEMIAPVVKTMKAIGFKKALVFHGTSGNGGGGMDELSPLAESFVAELSEDGAIRRYTLTPETAGISRISRAEEIAGGNDPEQEALKLLNVFTAKKKTGLYETICLNAAPVFYVAGTASCLKDGVELSRAAIDSGKALDTLRQWVRTQNRDASAGTERLEFLMSQL